MNAVPRTLWLMALGLALLNGGTAYFAERETAKAGLEAEAASAAEVLAGAWLQPPTRADYEAARKKLVGRPGFRALVTEDGQGQIFGDATLVAAGAAHAARAGRPWRGTGTDLVGAAVPLLPGTPAPSGFVFVAFDAAPVRAVEVAALGWGVRVACAWALGLLAAAWAFHGWWARRVAALAAACAGVEPNGPPPGARAQVYELDGLADVFTVMAAVRHDTDVRRARARFAAERERGEPEMVEAYHAELATPLVATMAGRSAALGATEHAAGTFTVAIETPTGGCALAGRLRGGQGLRLAVEADGARRLVSAMLRTGATPEAAWSAVATLWPIDAWDLALWGEQPMARFTLVPGALAPTRQPVPAGPVVLGTFSPAVAGHMAAYAARLGTLPPGELRDDMLDLVSGDEDGALVLLA